jgi:hypothetical protein
LAENEPCSATSPSLAIKKERERELRRRSKKKADEAQEKQRQALGVEEGEHCGVYKERGNWKEVKKVKEILV